MSYNKFCISRAKTGMVVFKKNVCWIIKLNNFSVFNEIIALLDLCI